METNSLVTIPTDFGLPQTGAGRLLHCRFSGPAQRSLTLRPAFGETIERHRRSYRVAIAGKLCIHWDQIIDALDRDPVTGVKHHRNVGTTRFIFELRDGPLELQNSSVGLCTDDVKPAF